MRQPSNRRVRTALPSDSFCEFTSRMSITATQREAGNGAGTCAQAAKSHATNIVTWVDRTRCSHRLACRMPAVSGRATLAGQSAGGCQLHCGHYHSARLGSYPASSRREYHSAGKLVDGGASRVLARFVAAAREYAMSAALGRHDPRFQYVTCIASSFNQAGG